MDNETYANVCAEDVDSIVLAITKNGGKATVEKVGETFNILASYPPIVEQAILDNLRMVGGL